jgi:hypothetical protein
VVPRRGGIEDGAAGDRRVRPQDQPVAARGDHRLVQAELGEALAGARRARGDGRGAVVDGDRGRDRRQRLEQHVEPVARPVRAGLDERVAAAELPTLYAR